MITSEQVTTLTEALVNFHREVGKIKKESENPFLKSRYADLSAILDTINEPLTSNGLVITQWPEEGFKLTTRLSHTSGQWMQSTTDLSPVPEVSKLKNIEYISPQAHGSAITYCRRYAQLAILNLNVSDDDGNAASQRQPDPRVTPKPSAPKGKFIATQGQVTKAIGLIKSGQKGVVDKMKESFDLTPAQLSQLQDALKQKP